ncbi:MAG: 4-hydroxy-3-methylbut-2-enyl diphosphate reductase [Rhodospirillaceae bacterium]|nr:4-hydroxy-3-methylbut-2-enyl diphosphate reductase [Rhodospirillaceae bacterium]|tara:strand:- start:185 stop:1150 length:966 start_codon:yes stop_codon:yes gene_type:complete
MKEKLKLKIVLAKPRGFCAGVERAIEIVEKALIQYGPPVYVRHEIVHNRRVIENLKSKGAVFVESLDEIPQNSVTIFSAHGVSKLVEDSALVRKLQVIDATCPLVKKVHIEGRRAVKSESEVILIGHEGHPEVEGTMGQIPGKVYLVSSKEDIEYINPKNQKKLAYITQTTLSVDDTREIISALKIKFPLIKGQDIKDICYATQNRQTAVRSLAEKSDIVLVIGSKNSSNSNRLVEIASSCGSISYLIEDSSSVDLSWFRGRNTIGITAGASAPEELIDEIVNFLQSTFEVELYEDNLIEENVSFRLPNVLNNTKEEKTIN